MVYTARPCVSDRSIVAYPNISDSGAWASTTCAVAALDDPVYFSAPCVEIVYHRAHIVRRDHDLDFHDRLQNGGRAAAACIFKGHGPRYFKGHLGGIVLAERHPL